MGFKWDHKSEVSNQCIEEPKSASNLKYSVTNQVTISKVQTVSVSTGSNVEIKNSENDMEATSQVSKLMVPDLFNNVCLSAPDSDTVSSLIRPCDNNNSGINSKSRITCTNDLAMIFKDVKIINKEGDQEKINKSIDCQDDLIPQLMVLPCGHMSYANGIRRSAVVCDCGKSFDLSKCDEVTTYAKVTKFTA